MSGDIQYSVTREHLSATLLADLSQMFAEHLFARL